MKVLNLYAGIGGNRKLWEDVEVTAVEIVPEIAEIYQDFFPEDKMIIGDAHQFLLDHFKEYDFIWSSPPCPSHSRARFWGSKGGLDYEPPVYPDLKLYEEIILLDHYYDGKYCVENVISFYEPLIKPQTVGRHYFWANFLIRDKRSEGYHQHHGDLKDLASRKGFDLSKYTRVDKRKILRNCVEPEIGLVVLESVRGNTQQTLVSIISKSKQIGET